MVYPRSIGLALVLLAFQCACIGQATASNPNQIYGGLWEIGPTMSTDLTLEAVGQGLTATVLIYSSSGTQLAAQSIPLVTGKSTHVSLADFVSGSGQGGLAVQWSGSGLVRGTVSIAGDNGISASYVLESGIRFDTENALYAPWYLPNGATTATLSLFNSSSAALGVEVSMLVGGLEKKLQAVSLQPASTQALDLRQLLQMGDLSQTTMGAIVVRYSGAAHSLQPVLFIESQTMGFALIPPFAAKHSQEVQNRTTWHFPNVPLPIAPAGTLGTAAGGTSYALVTNGIGQQMTTQIRSYAVVNRRSVHQDLDVPTLAPYETRLINLGTSQPPWVAMAKPSQAGSAAPRASSNPAGITITHSGNPGDVAIAIFTVSASGQVLGRSSGIVLSTKVTDVGYLNTVLKNPVKYGVRNATQSTYVTVYFQSLLGIESYSAALPQAAKPGGTIDLSGTFRHGKSDVNGDVLPAGFRAGMLVLSTSAPGPIATSAAQPVCLTACNTTQAATINNEVGGVQPEFNSGNDGSLETPCIYYNGSCVNGQTIDVVVGQQIVLVAVIPPADQSSVTSQSWSWGSSGTPTGYAVGCSSSYTGSSTPQTVTSTPYATCSGSSILPASASPPPTTFNVSTNYPLPSLSNPNGTANSTGSTYTFWWTAVPGSGVSKTLSFSYVGPLVLTNPDSDPASVTFTVETPTVTEYVCGGNLNSGGATQPCSSGNSGTKGTTVKTSSGILGYGDSSSLGSNFGIQFTASASGGISTSGILSFLQVLTPYTYSYYTSYPSSKYCTGQVVPSSTPELDNFYPYALVSYAAYTVNDNPGWSFPSSPGTYPGLTTDFHAKMYTLWQPPGTNSIPVPMGYVTWSWDGIATYSGGSWNVSGSSTSSESGFTSSTAYPTWGNVFVNGTPVTCYP